MGIFQNAFSGWHLILILAVVLLLFGATKLPGLAKSVGESIRILRTETTADKKSEATATPAAPTDETRRSPSEPPSGA